MTVAVAPQTKELVLSCFPPERRGSQSVQALASLLNNFVGATDLETRLDAFVELKQWVAANGASPAGVGTTRLETTLDLLESESELRSRFQQAVRDILTEMESVELFAEAGLHPRQDLWSEAWRRVIEHILPSVMENKDLRKLIFRLYPTHQAIDRLIALPDATFERIAAAVAPDDPGAWARQRVDLTQALYLLAVHVAGLGLSPALRARSHEGDIEESPFYELQQASMELVSELGSSSAVENWRDSIAACREELEYVRRHMEDTGVSTALVFDLWTIEKAVARMECIAEVLFPSDPDHTIPSVKRLLDDVMNAERHDMSLRELFAENSALIARKVVERTGKAGEHYIANNKSEYREIWRASLGGGLLTVLTAAIKMKIVDAQLPAFIEGIAAGTNYAVSFILLQKFHLALATKQPSVTAATFAGIVRTTHGKTRLEKLVEFISRITRSQLASAAGNLIAVCLGCIAFAMLWALLFARPYLEPKSAEHVYETLNPFASGTMIYATLTGVILWVSALAGGWFENFATFNRIPEAIEQHPLGRRYGRERMKRIAQSFENNVSGWITSIVLGYLLGFTPAIGRFIGIPLDVRHVTLSTGTLALAAASFGRGWLQRGWFVFTLVGIAVTFVLNLGVSFSIAASVGMKAYGVSWPDQLRVMRFTLSSFLKSPKRFLWPARDEAPTVSHQPLDIGKSAKSSGD